MFLLPLGHEHGTMTAACIARPLAVIARLGTLVVDALLLLIGHGMRAENDH
jgi:hypothetical protein